VTCTETPNPNARKFSVNRSVIPRGTLALDSPIEARDHALAAALFEIDGVQSIFATGDFVTVTRAPGADWDAVSPAVESVLRDQLS
jgi:hypothetical protein